MNSNQSLERGLAILDLLDKAKEPMGVRAIGRELDISPAIVQRLANTLMQAGFIEQDRMTRRYKLGYRAITLGSAFAGEDQLLVNAGQELQRLADEFQLNGYLGALRDGRVVYLKAVQSSGPIVVRAAVGSVANAHATALGKALLAQLEAAEIEAILGPAPYPRYTASTITQLSHLLTELESVRRGGFALSLEENIVGVISLGAVVRDGSNAPVAALSVAFLASQRPEPEWPPVIQLMLDAAHRCSQALGYRGVAVMYSGAPGHAA
jgi:DNA-binding IclR family transcriptional regulator